MDVINDPYRQGSTLNTILGSLLQYKADSMRHNQLQKAFADLGLSEKQSSALPNVPESVQKEYVKQHIQAPQQQAFANALGTVLGQGQNAPSSMTEKSQNAQQNMLPIEVRKNILKQLQSPEGKKQFTPDERIAIAQSLKNPSQQDMAQFNQMRSADGQLPNLQGLNQQQAFQIAQLALEQRKNADKQRAEAFKITKEDRKEILEKARAARINLEDLERLEQLEDEGLITAGYNELLKRSGLDIPALSNPASEEFQKIAQTFIRDAKTYLGSRISNFELEQFLKTIPSLSQSPEGRKRVISNLKRLNRVNLAYNDTMKSIMRENPDRLPYDLLEQIDDRISPLLNDVSKQFRHDLQRKVPEAQNQYITAGQAALGSVIGFPAKIIQRIASIGSHGAGID